VIHVAEVRLPDSDAWADEARRFSSGERRAVGAWGETSASDRIEAAESEYFTGSAASVDVEDHMSSLRLIMISGALMFAVACGNNYSSPSAPSPSPTPSASPTPAPIVSSAVAIPVGAQALGNRAYSPDELDVPVGTAVTWMNTDSIAHTSTSNGAGWDSGIVAPGGAFSFTFQTAGTFQYHCAIHPGMTGTVVVH
jgi:plastocyanin